MTRKWAQRRRKPISQRRELHDVRRGCGRRGRLKAELEGLDAEVPLMLPNSSERSAPSEVVNYCNAQAGIRSAPGRESAVDSAIPGNDLSVASHPVASTT